MIAANQLRQVQSGIRLRPIALPIEHGGWGLLLEPIALGMLLAPSIAGVLLALATVCAFLTRHPFKLAATDRTRKRRSQRTAIAERFAVLYFSLAALFFVAAVLNSRGEFWLALLAASPLIAIQLAFDSKGRSRSPVAELCGTVATGAFAAAIAICGGWSREAAFVLWPIVIARSVPTILYLRSRLRLLHRKPASLTTPILAHVSSVAMMVLFAKAGFAPWLAVGSMSVLLLRALFGIRATDPRITAKKLGVTELVYGALNVLAVVIGFRLAW